ncbi:MAG TPA: R3H domain-containing nucleic acid-binding protein [Polyangiaceae bacterium]|jgi:spoIIIJ-associated protein|nr:R3H domain-containing nucleic acid-binding protein [Polyangiaceae bacterium]
MTDTNENEVNDDAWDEEDEGEEGEGEESEGVPSSEGGAPRGAGDNGRAQRDEPPYEGDDRAKAALAFVDELLEQMDMDCDVELRRPKQEEPNEIQLEIYGRDAGRIIGKKGQVLSALQYLTNRMVNRPGLEKRYVTVDAEGYRSRRDDTLATMARRLGKQAITEGKIITFEPMNPRDRRVIHLALAKLDGVVTKSEGEGEDRRVQIIPVRR